MQFEHHIRIVNLDANLLIEGRSATPILAIRNLSAELSHAGLSNLISSLIPEGPLRATIADESGVNGCRVQLQATRMGFNARINISVRPAPNPSGGILINVDPLNRWSPLDRVMLGIAEANLRKVANKQAGITRLRSGGYHLDLQSIIRDQLLDNAAPVRWDARLDRLEGSPRGIRVDFVSFADSNENHTGPLRG